MIRAQGGDLILGDKMRSILLNLETGWCSSFGVGQVCEASSSTVLHPNPQYIPSPFCWERLSLVKKYYRTHSFCRIYLFESVFCVGLKIEIQKRSGSWTGFQRHIQQAMFPPGVKKKNYIGKWLFGWSSWLKREGKLQRETLWSCKVKCYSFRLGLIVKQSTRLAGGSCRGSGQWEEAAPTSAASKGRGDHGCEWVPGSASKWLWVPGSSGESSLLLWWWRQWQW